MVQNKQQIMQHFEATCTRKDPLTTFFVGDTIQVHFKVKEGKRERIQVFEGIVIAMRGVGLGKTFAVRKISFNVGVERVFPFHSPKISKIVITQRGKVRRAKLYYLRNRLGKAFQVKRLNYEEEKRLESKLSKNLQNVQ